MTALKQTCTPCKGGVPPLNVTEAKEFILQTPGWSLNENATEIARHIAFANFADALAFVNKVGHAAEEQNHHPEIQLGWGYVEIQIYTHKINGLHENDFVLAACINELLN
jgi:4a-hydroxytetrahydrobiopterin dehydratase